ncbi:MAG TPA: C4-type zinc ribbon domain-containing protein [archaeon]|nr:C4-type zinc ribbon domain-containing protein [archaeon]
MEEMDVLLKLQEIDLQLNEIKTEHENIPLLIAELDKDVNELKADLEKQGADLKKYKLASREAESKVAQLDEIARKYKQQLLNVKTNREYSALLTEIEAVKGEKEELEEQIIKNMERAEEITAQVELTKGKLAEAEKSGQENKNELAGKMKSLEAEMAAQGRKRNDLVSRVNGPVLNLYERIMRSRVKQAVVPLHNGSCGGCYAIIPLQKIVDIRKANQIYTCDYCGRILYYEENQGN